VGDSIMKSRLPLADSLDEAGRMAGLGVQALGEMFTRPFEVRLWIREMEQIGVRSLGVAAIATIFTGMVLALQTAYSLPGLGVKYYIGTVVSKSIIRELGPVLIALVVGGRIAAGMTAELGTMKVTEQIDALRAMATNPVKKLVVPKLIAALVMLPLLTIIGDLLGVMGGMIIGVYQLDLTPGFYFNDVLTDLTLEDIFSGIGKSFFFAFWITIVGCYNGLTARGGADGVGRATTNTVVVAAILVLVTDFFLTKLFHFLA
jgi:phospholipid/cholesterol/gamma-HCH transport system permease protein